MSCWKAAAGLLLLGTALWALPIRDSSSSPSLCNPLLDLCSSSQTELKDVLAVDDRIGRRRAIKELRHPPAVSSLPPPPPVPTADTRRCGDGRCEPRETSTTCGADCPGVTTPAQCGEEPHSDPGGHAVVWGASHKVDSAAECCQRCSEHAANPRNAKRPCNSWVFCYESPQCWALDTGNWHAYGECWLKWQADPFHPLYGQRGAYSADFRKKHWRAHLTGRNPDGTRRNLTVPTHVDHSVTWETGLDGMRSSAGTAVVMWRAWETKDQNLARGVPPEQMGLAAKH